MDAANDRWGEDWPRVRRLWPLDPSVAFLNHGSFGACPTPVLQRQSELRAALEREPVQFLTRKLRPMLEEALERVAGFVRADPSGTVFVRNATTAVSTVLASTALEPGDEVLTTDHAYPAVLNAIERRCEAAGAKAVVAEIPLPLPLADEILERIAGAATARTRLAVVDHVTSSTAAILPVERAVAALHDRGVPVLVDAAHGPGMLDVDVEGLGADYWTGNLHKWVCAPKGAAVLVTAAARRDDLRPLVTSHGAGGGQFEEFHWPGTDDPTAWLTAPTALDVLGELGWERLRTHNHALVIQGRDTLAHALGTIAPVPEEATGWMTIVPLPDGAVASQEEGWALGWRLFDERRIEVPIMWWSGRAFVRISAHAYNHPAEYERLGRALPAML